MGLVLRRDKGSALTHDEVDDNFLAAASSSGSANGNLVYGGNFHTNPWANGTSFNAVANEDYTANHWYYLKASTSSVNTISQIADAPTVAEAGIYVEKSLGVATTTNDTSPGTNGLVAIATAVSGYDFTAIAQQGSVLTFWVKYSNTGTFAVAIRNTAKDRSYVATYDVDAADTWEQKTIIIPASPAAGTWDYEDGVGAEVVFTLMAGTAFEGTNETWNTGNIVSVAGTTNAVDSVSNVFKINLVKWELGDTATPFTNREHALEELLASSDDGNDSGTILFANGTVIYSGKTTVPANSTRTITLPQTLSSVTFHGAALNELNTNGVYTTLYPTSAPHTELRIHTNWLAGATSVSWQVIGKL